MPGVIALDPDINPESPDEDDKKKVKDGIRVRRGSISKGGQNKPKAGTFVPDAEQPNERTDDKDRNRDWTSQDTKEGPLQPGGWRRAKIDGDLPDPTESTDDMRIEFEPCLEPGEPFEVTLCFDEQLDENDFIHFTPSDKSGSAIGGGDTTASETLSVADILKILGSLAGAGASKLIGARKKVTNKTRRREYATRIVNDRQLLKLVHELAPNGPARSLSEVVDEFGSAAVLAAFGADRIIRTIGTKELVKNLKELGLDDEVKEALDS